ncbi:MAG: dihydrolipoyl dehydrogenase [Pseudomonadota bacterium]|nr:dihydrolipoyl dehydrogenase [Pseudomonadota bacterium]
MTKDSFDIVVIGGGPGGYVAAIRAAQLGLSVACVERRGTLGGTCLTVGCIPSKALLHDSELFELASHDLAAHGVKVSGVKLDLAEMMKRKDSVVSDLTKGIEHLLKKNKVEHVAGNARITGKREVTIEDDGRVLQAANIIIATGSESTLLPGIEIDEKRIVTSTGALALAKVPKHFVVIGGGFIGLELGSVWRRLGAEVTVVEFLDRLLPTMDGEISKHFKRILGKQGFAFKLKTKVTGAVSSTKSVKLTLEPAAGGDVETLDADVVLVSIGRRANTEGLGLEPIGVVLDELGRVMTDNHFRSSVENIFAIGDVIAGPMLAHKAEEEGMAAAEIIAGQSGHVNYDTIPGVVYTSPEAASVGKTEEQLKAAGIAYKVGKFPFMANSRGRANDQTDGFVKILADAGSNRVLGVHIVGADAGEIIAEAVVAMEFGASAEDIARTCHAHPSLSEAVREAALAVDGRPIHI